MSTPATVTVWLALPPPTMYTPGGTSLISNVPSGCVVTILDPYVSVAFGKAECERNPG